MKAEKYFTQETIAFIRSKIKESSDNEVFFTGQINENGIIFSVKVGANGNSHSVPVNFEDARKAAVLIHNHPSGRLTPSDADISVASHLSEQGLGFYIIDNECSNLYIVVEPVLPKVVKKINEEEAGLYLSSGGPLSEISENYEERPVQIELLQKIAQAFNKNQLAAFEAGTGVGKSFAYLIPSIIWAIDNKEKVVVSTGTINLQQQLCEKDIPLAQKIIGRKIKFLLMKGRQNFICRRRFEDAILQRELFDEDNEIFDKLKEWVKSTSSGSRSELPFLPPENLWSRINSESDACLGMRCPFHAECFVMKMRKEAAGADILVVNHHLLFADIESRMHGVGYDDAAVLPPYRRIIFDEAHSIENAATSFFSESFNRFKITKQLNQLYRKRKNSESGFLCTIAILSSNEEKAMSAYELVNNIKNDISNLELASLDLLQDEYNLRLYDANARAFGPVITLCNTLARDIDNFVALCREVMEGIADEDKDIPAFFETKILVRRLEDCALLLKDFSQWDEKRDTVFWIAKKSLSKELSKDSSDSIYVTFTETPLDIAPLMAQGVFEPMESVICTSATLKTGRDFSYWMRRTGLSYSESQRLSIKDFPSPFPYNKNMLFAVPSDAPLPESGYIFQQWIENAIVKLIEASEGRTLVLFTSYESLRSAFNVASRNLSNFSGALLRQGADDNARLLDNFRKDITSVLFATDSFWQGVDVPGEALSQVIIVKLPFTVPNDPVFTARAEAIKNRGGSSFMELSLPEAVIKFRQGIGRLMRRGSDRGSVVVLDRRLYEKHYGSVFLANVPECKRLYSPLDQVCNAVSDFIFR
ncbi:MAG: DEAD/DEAH box helicase family protein [Treponema sp.]|nr:DEAD/DEAH box helicase family protein [Treponema sp.]